VAEYWNKLQTQHGTADAEGESLSPKPEAKPRRDRRRGGGGKRSNQPIEQQPHAPLVVQPAGPTPLPTPGAAAPAYPLYYYPVPNFPPQPYMMPQQAFPGAPPAAALYGAPALPLAGAAGPTASIPIPGLPVPLQVPLQPAMAPLNWQQQELIGNEGAKKPQRNRGGGRGRGPRGVRGGHAGDQQPGQQPQQQWKPRNAVDEAGAPRQPQQQPQQQQGAQQPPRQRRGRGGGRRPDRDAGRDAGGGEHEQPQQSQPPKDQKDQLTWQQKLLLS
jgi:hypothetical protein